MPEDSKAIDLRPDEYKVVKDQDRQPASRPIVDNEPVRYATRTRSIGSGGSYDFGFSYEGPAWGLQLIRIGTRAVAVGVVEFLAYRGTALINGQPDQFVQNIAPVAGTALAVGIGAAWYYWAIDTSIMLPPEILSEIK